MPHKRLQRLHVAIAVIERRGRYLICQRHPDDHLGGYWEFPGGTRKPGESWETCLRRELREELDVAVRALHPYGRMRYRYADRAISFNVFRCAIAEGRPRPLGARVVRWVAPRQLSRYRFPPADNQLIERLARR
jgi:mutator protein MutT